MAEIKSTLDLIMEKTKNLTLTEEEKKHLKTQEIKDKLNGLFLRYLEGHLKMDNFTREVNILAERDRSTVHQGIIEKVQELIRPAGIENNALLAFLDTIHVVETTLIRHRLEKYEKRIEHEQQAFEKSLEEQYKKKGITGSAVVPNIPGNEKWIAHLSGIMDEFRREISNLE